MPSNDSEGATAPATRQIATGAIVFTLALLLWSIWPVPRIWALVAAYFLALVTVNLALRSTTIQVLAEQLSRWPAILILFLAAAGPLSQLARSWQRVAAGERLTGIGTHVNDRRWLEAKPSIFPPLLYTESPQRYFIHAPSAKEVSVAWRESDPALSAVSLGQGLFRLDYNPHGASNDDWPTTANARITVDGDTTRKAMKVVRPHPHPRWFHSLPAHGIAATVSEETDELVIVRREGGIARIPTADAPTDCLLIDDGRRAVVSHRYDPQLWIVDLTNGERDETIELGTFQVRLALSPDSKLLAIALDGQKPEIALVELATNKVVKRIPLDFRPDWITFGENPAVMFVSSQADRALYRLLNYSDIDNVFEATQIDRFPPLGSGAPPHWVVDPQRLNFTRPVVTMARGNEENTLYVAVTARGETTAHAAGNHFVQNVIHHIDTHAWRIDETIVTDERTEAQQLPGDIDRGVSPMGFAAFESAAQLIAMAGSDEVRLHSDEIVEPIVFDVGQHGLYAPHGVADLGGGIWCVSSPVSGAIGLFDIEGELLKLHRLAPPPEELGSVDPEALLRRRGERSFYETTRAGLSCQSCHLHGGSDDCLHDIGQGAYAGTLSVRGIAGTSPYLRDGSFARIRDLNLLAEQLYRGYSEEVTWDRGKAVAAYIESLPPPVNWRWLTPGDIQSQRAGVKAFVKAQCAKCHTFPAMTNLSQHPRTLLFPEPSDRSASTTILDTPSLRAISTSAPYLHDGRASTLADVLTEENEHNRHGDVDVLTAAEQAALIEFLKSL